MNPSLTWLDLTGRDRDRMRRVMDLFSEQGTVDEMGLGTLRDALADALFPGTSTIQTRLRYTLFIPWIYQRLESREVSDADIGQNARDAEIELIDVLLASDKSEGIIGSVARSALSRLPSSVYWAGLVHWGIFGHAQSLGWYHAHFSSLQKGASELNRADDPGVTWLRQATWHPRLPKPPHNFPREASFALNAAEADFICGRFSERCPNTLLSWLACEGSSSLAELFWDDPVARNAPASQRVVVELARRFSLHVQGLPLLYNLMLAELRYERQGTDQALIASYREEIAHWADSETSERTFQPNDLWAFMARHGATVLPPQKTFVEAWSHSLTRLGARIVDDPHVRRLVKAREESLKTQQRARLVNPARLLDWSGRVGVGRMDFRWFRTRRLLQDLHEGLES